MNLEKSLDCRSPAWAAKLYLTTGHAFDLLSTSAKNSLCSAIAASLCAVVELSISLNLCISSESSELPAHITCKMQGAFFVLSLPLSSEVSLLSTADCQACLTCLRLNSLPALPVPYGLLWSSYWNKEAWLGLLTKKLLWKKTKECCSFRCSSSDFVSDAILWQFSQ